MMILKCPHCGISSYNDHPISFGNVTLEDKGVLVFERTEMTLPRVQHQIVQALVPISPAPYHAQLMPASQPPQSPFRTPPGFAVHSQRSSGCPVQNLQSVCCQAQQVPKDLAR